ncbi:MAG: nucleotide exchange factor GrpE [bacterium]|nr:nucleotide exchange factor GrpE [bacterium]
MSKKHPRHEGQEEKATAAQGPAESVSEGPASAVTVSSPTGSTSTETAAPETSSTSAQDELALLRAQAEEWKNKYLYALAEIENMRKRGQKERSELLRFAGQNVLYDLLEVVDNFGRALEADRAQSDPKIIVEGIELIYKQLLDVLHKHHVRPIEAAGAVFDPSVHEALLQVPTDEAKPGTVVAELQRGYFLRDRVLRPARVAVAVAPPAESQPASPPAAPDLPTPPIAPSPSPPVG